MDAAGFDAFYRATAQPVAQQVQLMLGDAAETRHAVHVAYARTWKGWKRLSQRPAPEFWTRANALRIARSRRRRMLRSILGRGRRIPAEALPYAARDEAVVEALSRLPVRQRDALVLHYVVDLDVAAVAQVMRSTPDRTRTRLDHARAALAELLPHLLGAQAMARVPAAGVRPALPPGPAAAGPAAAGPAAAGPPEPPEPPAREPEPGPEAAVRRYLQEAAQRQTPALLPPADVRKRRWRRRYYTTAGAAALVAAGVTGAAMAASATLGDRSDSLEVPPLATESATPSGAPRTSPASPPSPGDAATPTAPTPTDGPSGTQTAPGSPTPGASGGFSVGRTDARATDVPANRRDLGFVTGRVVRDGGTFLRFDRALLRGNGTIENQNKLVREVPLAEDVTVAGGRRLPPDITVPELMGLIDAGVVRDIAFVLRYDENDQVDEIRELLQQP